MENLRDWRRCESATDNDPLKRGHFTVGEHRRQNSPIFTTVTSMLCIGVASIIGGFPTAGILIPSRRWGRSAASVLAK